MRYAFSFLVRRDVLNVRFQALIWSTVGKVIAPTSNYSDGNAPNATQTMYAHFVSNLPSSV